ncbi:MAG: UDP-N-acetylmuramoyl-L-alanine--D-glutamate ligase [Solirubrobacterales bacterium]
MAAHPRPPLPPGPWLVVGLRRSGVAAAAALWRAGEPVICVDSGDPPGLEVLREEGIDVETESDGLEALERARAVVKSPGVPAQAPVIAAARERGIPVLGELELGWRLLPNPFVAVTGTNGKTTTVELLGEIWGAAGLPVAVAGNVGTAVSSLPGRLEPDATVICEASSFQLEDSIAFDPEVAVFLNFSPDHLDRHGTEGNYLAAKLQLFDHQDGGDFAVGPAALVGQAGGEAQRVVVASPPESEGDIRVSDGWIAWNGEPVMEVASVRLRGRHNLENALCAAGAALAWGVPAEAVAGALAGFAGVEHRIEEVGRAGGALWINDSKATNVASTAVALEAFDEPVLLIAGGQAKGQDFGALAKAARGTVRKAFLLGEDAGLLAAALEPGTPYARFEDLDGAVEAAAAEAREGEVVLLSPACASFDLYPGGFEERGAHFRALAAGIPGFSAA